MHLAIEAEIRLLDYKTMEKECNNLVWLIWHVMELCLQSCHVCLVVGCARGIIEQVVQAIVRTRIQRCQLFFDVQSEALLFTWILHKDVHKELYIQT